jgi:polyhydroxybutyrate depolymerase
MLKFKSIILIPLCLLISICSYSQQTIKTSIIHDGLTRTFSFYVPAKYTGGNAVPLVFNLHGYGSNSDQQEFYGDFRKIADTAGFIVVHPNGTLHPQTNQQFWNCGLIAGGGSVDDIGFIHALIDTLSSAYTIDQERIYSTGMSNGGFMSYHLACLSERFAAIASVTGSMSVLTKLQCQNATPLPVMEIHGTADAVVNYNGSNGVHSIPEVLDFWIAKNGLNKQDLIYSKVPDINTSDGATAELYIYPGTNEVQHYKVINGGHTWPGSIIPIVVTCQDFNASLVIWNFFARYKKQTIATKDFNYSQIDIRPNPANHTLKISLNDFTNELQQLSCYNQCGKWVTDFKLTNSETLIDISNLAEGIYFLHGNTSNKIYKTKLVKQ